MGGCVCVCNHCGHRKSVHPACLSLVPTQADKPKHARLYNTHSLTRINQLSNESWSMDPDLCVWESTRESLDSNMDHSLVNTDDHCQWRFNWNADDWKRVCAFWPVHKYKLKNLFFPIQLDVDFLVQVQLNKQDVPCSNQIGANQSINITWIHRTVARLLGRSVGETKQANIDPNSRLPLQRVNTFNLIMNITKARRKNWMVNNWLGRRFTVKPSWFELVILQTKNKGTRKQPANLSITLQSVVFYSSV